MIAYKVRVLCAHFRIKLLNYDPADSDNDEDDGYPEWLRELIGYVDDNL